MVAIARVASATAAATASGDVNGTTPNALFEFFRAFAVTFGANPPNDRAGDREPERKTSGLGPRDVFFVFFVTADVVFGFVVVVGRVVDDARVPAHHRARQLGVGSHDGDADVERGVAVLQRRLRR